MEKILTELAAPIVISLCVPLFLFWLRTIYSAIVHDEATVRNADHVTGLVQMCYPGVLEAIASGTRMSMPAVLEELEGDYRLAQDLARRSRSRRLVEYGVAETGFVLARAVFALVSHLASAESLQRRSLATMALSVRCMTGLGVEDLA